MRKLLLLTLAVIYATGLYSIDVLGQRQTQNPEPKRSVYINDKRIADKLINYLEVKYRIRIADGDYWYDRVSGLWGFEGGPTQGVIPAGWKLGGKLKSDASKGKSGVYINGRQLRYSEVTYLRNLVGRVNRGRYWLNSKGYAGFVGQRALVNLYELSRKKRRGAIYRNFYTGVGSGGSGKDFYVIGKDWSY